MEATLNVTEYIHETKQLKEFPAILTELQNQYKNVPKPTKDYPKIIFLGTGSCVPNKTRNVSAILLQTAADSYVLLDCGEGTLGQIVRFFGQEKAEHVMRQLKLIYISHLHADHHIGLIALLNEYNRLQSNNPLFLLAPSQIELWLQYYDRKIENIRNAYKLINNATMILTPMQLNAAETGVQSISTCLVRHCPFSYGIALNLHDNYKITYSGDTMPCEDLVELGRNSKILIHEATMEDDLLAEAELKLHSTISQAIEQGKLMQAEYIILTHFSQRYAKLPRMQTELNKNVTIAFDNMQVTAEDLTNFHFMYPALKALFAEHAEELEQKALKRELKLERKRKIEN